MRRIARWAGLLLSCCLVLASGPAIGQTLRFDDPAGDGQKGTHLDITSIKVANRDHVLVTTISFVKVAAGDLAVGFKQRGRGPRAAKRSSPACTAHVATRTPCTPSRVPCVARGSG
jgi:hypothetical protein